MKRLKNPCDTLRIEHFFQNYGWVEKDLLGVMDKKPKMHIWPTGEQHAVAIISRRANLFR
jgi:hypothetical protein